jgi:hypothetical protein
MLSIGWFFGWGPEGIAAVLLFLWSSFSLTAGWGLMFSGFWF